MNLTWHTVALVFLAIAIGCHVLEALAVGATRWQAWAWAWTTAAAFCLLI